LLTALKIRDVEGKSDMKEIERVMAMDLDEFGQ